jgi:glycosyltransferase involved in cell wall biosynthesis
VIPSLWPDNAPMAAYEAMACGRAVIGSDLGGLQDQVEPGRSGVLLPAGDAASLARAVRQLWSDPEQAQRMGRAGRERMERLFSPQRHLEALMGLFGAAPLEASGGRAAASGRAGDVPGVRV